MKNKIAKTLPKILRGSVHRQFKKCGKPNCKCAAGKLHGAYYYHFVRINGKLKKRYLKADEVEPIQIACIKRRRDEKLRWARFQADWEQLREIRTEMSELKNHFSS